jgi:carbonic anhydrase
MIVTKTTEVIVAEHTVQLGYIVGAIGDIKDTLKEISTTQRHIEVVMERQSNHEEKNGNEHKRIHTRIDQVEDDIKNMIDTHRLKCDLLEPQAANGEKAYKALMWVLAGVGALVINTLYDKFLHGAGG